MSKDIIEEFEKESEKANQEKDMRETVQKYKLNKDYHKVLEQSEYNVNTNEINLDVDLDLQLERWNRLVNFKNNSIPLEIDLLSNNQFFRLEQSEVTTVLGNTNAGKSTFVSHVLHDLILEAEKLNKKVLLISPEDTFERIMPRLICKFSGLKINEIFLETNQEIVLDWNKRIIKSLIIIDQETPLTSDGRGRITSVDSFKATVRAWTDTGKISSLILDYYQVYSEMERLQEVMNAIVASSNHVNEDGTGIRCLLMHQSKKFNKEEPDNYIERMMREKQICSQKSQNIYELVSYPKEFRTVLHCQKSKYGGVGRREVLGYDKELNKYVKYDKDFLIKVEKWARFEQEQEINTICIDLGLTREEAIELGYLDEEDNKKQLSKEINNMFGDQ
jgi:hypothetical protein